MRILAAAALAVLVLPAGAFAHVTVSPPFVEDGVESEIAFQTPNERTPHVTVPYARRPRRACASSRPPLPPGWRAVVRGSEVTWTGGRIEGTRTVAFPVRIFARVRAGTYSFLSAQRYDDGATVRWKASVSVLPAKGSAAPSEHPWGQSPPR